MVAVSNAVAADPAEIMAALANCEWDAAVAEAVSGDVVVVKDAASTFITVTKNTPLTRKSLVLST